MRPIIVTLLLGLACCFSNDLSAQYTALGVRLGSPLSASFKFFPGESTAIEAFVGYRNQKVNFGSGSYGWTWINVGALYQVHKDLELGDITGLQYYYGGGASAYLWSYDDGFLDSDNYGSVTFGVHGNLGLDYTFDKAPINISVDWVPTVILGSGYSTGFGAGYGALSVRYILSRK